MRSPFPNDASPVAVGNGATPATAVGTVAGVAAAAAIAKIRRSSERYGVPLALAALKPPTGALTAFLGLLLMRGQFVQGLSALDISAQILAWALVFGYAQQLYTRLVDQQFASASESNSLVHHRLERPQTPLHLDQTQPTMS